MGPEWCSSLGFVVRADAQNSTPKLCEYSTISFLYSDSRSKIIIGVKSVIFPKDYKKGVVMAGMDGLKIQSSSVITLELRNLKNTSLMWNVNNIKICTLRLLDNLIFLFSSYITRRDFFQILWKSRCDSLVTEILTRKVELWIFSLVKKHHKTNFPVKSSVLKITISFFLYFVSWT